MDEQFVIFLGIAMTGTSINKTVMLMNVKLDDALCVAAAALLTICPGAVLSNEAITASENNVFASDQTKVTIGDFDKFVRATGVATQAKRKMGI